VKSARFLILKSDFALFPHFFSPAATISPIAAQLHFSHVKTHHGGPMNQRTTPDAGDKQLLHLVFGGELTSLDGLTFKDLARLDIVGIYPNYAAAHVAWKAKAQATVDNAQMRYFVVHLHRLLEPAAS
jgi:hypothetical protein